MTNEWMELERKISASEGRRAAYERITRVADVASVALPLMGAVTIIVGDRLKVDVSAPFAAAMVLALVALVFSRWLSRLVVVEIRTRHEALTRLIGLSIRKGEEDAQHEASEKEATR